MIRARFAEHRFKLSVIACLLLITGLAVWRYQKTVPPAAQPTQSSAVSDSNTSTPKLEPARDKSARTEQSWPRWGGALVSAFEDGKGFFDRARAADFRHTIAAADQKYVVHLHSRALLPDTNADVTDVLGNEGGEHVAYLQFSGAVHDPQREALATAGITLLNYVDGYAWQARGSVDAFKNSRELPFVRAIASIDPRDKIQEQVYRVYPFRTWEEGLAKKQAPVPAYAKTAEGDARFSLVAHQGTRYDDIVEQLKDRDALPASLQLIERNPSIFGPRFEVIADAALAPEIASIPSAAYLSFVPPPVASRDANTDEQSNINDVRDNPPNLSGAGVNVAVREIGKPALHTDYANRITYIDNGSTAVDDADHATGVTGQIGSNGAAQPTAKGVAPQVSLFAYAVDTSNGSPETFATTDIVDAATNKGARISNHSYGPTGLSQFGEYDVISADWDGAIKANNLIAMFAGNEEPGQTVNHIDFFVGCKNGVCVGASSKAAHAGDASTLTLPKDGLAAFSQWGPMDDGRIKPDIVANGDQVTLDQGTNAIQPNSGTSFATPAVSGATALIFERYKAVTGAEPSAALTKALLCNTATDLGNTGPDVKYGFGLLNVENAINMVDQAGTGGPFIEDSVGNGETKTYTIELAGAFQLRMTLCWMDAAGNPMASKALVNDLDLEVVSPSNVTSFPFSINKNSPQTVATATGANTVDPIEQLVINSPADGTWTIRVKGTAVPNGAPQPFAICMNVPQQPGALRARITANPVSGSAPLDVSFSGLQSTGTIQLFIWDFGDGTSGFGPVVSHTYAQTGIYTASLVAVGTQNNLSSATVVITVGSLAIVASPTSGAAPLAVSFASTSQSTSVTYTWRFGDASTGSGPNVEHTYTSPGTYDATLVVTDSAGKETEFKTTITVGRRIVDSFAGKAKLRLNFGGNDDFSFSMIANDPFHDPGYLWPRTNQQKREAINDGEFEAKTYTLKVGGESVTEIIIDRRGTYKSKRANLKLNLSRGEILCKLKGYDLAPKLGINQATTTPRITVPVEVEASDVIYRAVYPMDYKSNGTTGTGKSLK